MIDCVDRCVASVMGGRWWYLESSEGRLKAYAGGPRFERVVRSLYVRGIPCRIEVPPEDGASEPSPVVFGQLMMELM